MRNMTSWRQPTHSHVLLSNEPKSTGATRRLNGRFRALARTSEGQRRSPLRWAADSSGADSPRARSKRRLAGQVRNDSVAQGSQEMKPGGGSGTPGRQHCSRQPRLGMWP